MIVLGIDPGKKGALCALHIDNNEYISCIYCEPLPINKQTNALDIVQLNSKLKWLFMYARQSYNTEHIYCTLERQQPMGVEGLTSCFTIGYNYGLLHATCMLQDRISIIEYRPVQIANYIKGQMKDFCTNQKLINKSFAERILGKDSVVFKPIGKSRNSHEGIVDASVIAYYGYVRHFCTCNEEIDYNDLF